MCILGHITSFSSVPTPRLGVSQSGAVSQCVSVSLVPSHRTPEEWRGAGAVLVRAAGEQPSLPALQRGIHTRWRAKRCVKLLLSRSKLRRARQPLQPNRGGGNRALALPFISIGKASVGCTLPAADRGGECAAPFAWIFFYPVASPAGRQWWAGEAVPVITSGPAAGKSFFIMYLSEVTCKLLKQASSNAVLLVCVVKTPGTAGWAVSVVQALVGCGEPCPLSPPGTHVSCGVAKEKLLVYKGDF